MHFAIDAVLISFTVCVTSLLSCGIGRPGISTRTAELRREVKGQSSKANNTGKNRQATVTEAALAH